MSTLETVRANCGVALWPFRSIGHSSNEALHSASCGHPIEVSAGDQLIHATRHTHNVSLGGLAFQSDGGLEPGIFVEVRIPFVRPMFETKARVVWCSAREAGFELGVAFLDPEDAFRARMVEQVCHIENYKKVVYQAEGRLLTAEEAAMEWISKYASQFPNPGPEGMP